MYYILDGKTPVPADSVLEWAKAFETMDRHVHYTVLGETTISTVFLGINHNLREGKPLLFETMILGGEHDGFCERYSTWEEAEKGHFEACKTCLSN